MAGRGDDGQISWVCNGLVISLTQFHECSRIPLGLIQGRVNQTTTNPGDIFVLIPAKGQFVGPMVLRHI